MIAIINTGIANLNSVAFAFKRLGVDTIITTDKNEIENASRIVLPGVGTAHTAMRGLKQCNLIDVIRNLTQPVLGICLGMQLQYQFSEEGSVECLSLIKSDIKKFPKKNQLIVPHMGWNQLLIRKQSPLLKNIPDKSYVYFIHSFADFSDSVHTLTTTEHGKQFSSIIQHNNFFGTQFHPERSGKIGELILKNFLDIKL